MLLLDTHIFYWVVRDSPRLRTHHRELLLKAEVRPFVSAITGWEIAAKVRLGKWPEAAPLLPGLEAVIEQAGFQQLPLTMSQAERAGSFDVAHKDPFDRLIADQSLDQGLTLLTVDPVFALFGCKVV